VAAQSGRTVLITGGTGALGSAVTQRFLADGYNVGATYVVDAEADELAERVGDEPRLQLLKMDATDPIAIARSLDELKTAFGPADVLVHLVGAWSGGESVQGESLDTWNRMLDLNLRSAFLVCRAVLDDMYSKNWGRIVLVSSRTARQDRSHQLAYAIAKAGVAVLAETISEEGRGTGVTANIISPSALDTPANRKAMPDANHDAWVPVEDVAATIAFLASDEAGQLRGAWLPAYGAA
jgi:NAD(P)-dependent dehydrogenase (short-subunit alcohol dehydrogenase family)